MSEWLTTGEMVDRLKEGEVAEQLIGDFTYRVKKADTGSIMCLDSNGKIPGRHLSLEGSIVKGKWRILPNYVSFEEAMKALKEGENVYFHNSRNESRDKVLVTSGIFEREMESFAISEYSLRELIEGKWSIES